MLECMIRKMVQLNRPFPYLASEFGYLALLGVAALQGFFILLASILLNKYIV